MRNAFKKGEVNLITKISRELDFSMTLQHFSQCRPDALHALTTPDGADNSRGSPGLSLKLGHAVVAG